MLLGLFIIVLSGALQVAFTQNLQPIITGDSLLCPEGMGVVSTQEFESYQWFRRYYGSNNVEPLQGEVSRQLVMDYFGFAGSFVSVAVTQGAQSAVSPEFFVDGYVFLPPFVIISGEFTVGPEGELIICPGDTLTFELGLPYNTNITWYRNGQPIPEAHTNVLKVVDQGIYHVSAAPQVCPDYIQWLEVPLEVIWCPTFVENITPDRLVLGFTWSNEVLQLISNINLEKKAYRVFDAQGRLLGSGRVMNNTLHIAPMNGFFILHIEGLPAIKVMKP